MKCQRQITKIRWQDHIRNSEVAARIGLGPVSDLITRRRNSVFGHIARLSEDRPDHQALWCHVDLTLWPKLEASPRPSQQPMDWPAMQGQQQHATSWPVEKIHHTWSFVSDTTVLADYALMTMSTGWQNWICWQSLVMQTHRRPSYTFAFVAHQPLSALDEAHQSSHAWLLLWCKISKCTA